MGSEAKLPWREDGIRDKMLKQSPVHNALKYLGGNRKERNGAVVRN